MNTQNNLKTQHMTWLGNKNISSTTASNISQI